MAVQTGAEGDDLAPGGRATGVNRVGGQHGEAVPVRGRVGALVPRGGRQHAAEGPPPHSSARHALVGERDDGEAEPLSGEGAMPGGGGQAPAAQGVGAAEEGRGEGREEEEEQEREEEEKVAVAVAEAEARAVMRGAARPCGHLRSPPVAVMGW